MFFLYQTEDFLEKLYFLALLILFWTSCNTFKPRFTQEFPSTTYNYKHFLPFISWDGRIPIYKIDLFLIISFSFQNENMDEHLGENIGDKKFYVGILNIWC